MLYNKYAASILVLSLAALVAVLPQCLYEKDYAERAASVLDDGHLHDIFTTPTTVLVTGANSGLGLATIKHLTRLKLKAKVPSSNVLTVVMACRNMDKCHKARQEVLQQEALSINSAGAEESESHLPAAAEEAGLRLLPLRLDLADEDSIKTFAEHLQELLPTSTASRTETETDPNVTVAPPPIHIMVFNAGIAAPYPTLQYRKLASTSSVASVESHYAVNHLGHVLLAHYLWNNVLAVHNDKQHKHARKARIVTVSEGGALFPVNPLNGWHPDSHHTNDQAPRIYGKIQSMIGNILQYARSKQAQLYFASELQTRYAAQITTAASQPGYTRTSIYLTNFQGFPNWLKLVFRHNPIGSMSPQEGAKTLLLAILDETATYVGPKWFFWGPPVVLARTHNIDKGSPHHRPFAKQPVNTLWDKSLNILGITNFGGTD